MLFNELTPAFTFTATVKLPIIFGPVATGSTLTYADLVDGIFSSEPGFEPAIDAKAIRGGDWITIDPSGETMRLNLNTLLKTSDESPEYIQIQATGAEVATKEAMAIVTGAAGAKAINYGGFQAVSSWTLTTGSKKYWSVQNAVYVGSTSLKPGTENGTFIVGFKVAKAAKASLYRIWEPAIIARIYVYSLE